MVKRCLKSHPRTPFRSRNLGAKFLKLYKTDNLIITPTFTSDWPRCVEVRIYAGLKCLSQALFILTFCLQMSATHPHI